MVCCCVPHCKSRSGRSKGISFHEFPCNLDEREEWLKTISRKDFIPNDSSRSTLVCSLHFKEEDYIPGLKIRKLKQNSCPSVFPNYPSYMQPRLKTPRKQPTKRQCIQQAKESCADNTSISQYVPCDDTSYVLEVIEQHSDADSQTNITKRNSIVQQVKESHTDNTNTSETTISLPVPCDVTWDIPCDETSYVNEGIEQYRDADSQTNITLVSLKRNLNRLRMQVFRKNRSLIKQQEKLDSATEMLRNYTNDFHYKAFQNVIDSANAGNECAAFLLDQVDNYSRKRPKFCEATLRECAEWQFISPKGYTHARKRNILNLPGRTTLNKYKHPTNGEAGDTQLIEEQLQSEVESLD